MIPLLLIGASGVGLFSCWHFAAEKFGWAGVKAPDIVCSDTSCTKLADTPYANLLLGLPNWYFGTAFYALVVLSVAFPLLRGLALAGSAASLAMGAVLIWALTAKLRHFCGYCYLAHAANLSIFALLLIGAIR